MNVRLALCCALVGVAVFIYPVFVAPRAVTFALAGGAMALLILGLTTSRWLGAGSAIGLALVSYAVALASGEGQPDIYAPALAVASWLLLELFDLAVRARKQRQIDERVLDAQWRRLFVTSAAAAPASVAVLLAGVVFQAHPSLLPAAAAAATVAITAAAALTRRAVS